MVEIVEVYEPKP